MRPFPLPAVSARGIMSRRAESARAAPPPEVDARTLAVFDLDGTLIKGDSLLPTSQVRPPPESHLAAGNPAVLPRPLRLPSPMGPRRQGATDCRSLWAEGCTTGRCK